MSLQLLKQHSGVKRKNEIPADQFKPRPHKRHKSNQYESINNANIMYYDTFTSPPLIIFSPQQSSDDDDDDDVEDQEEYEEEEEEEETDELSESMSSYIGQRMKSPLRYDYNPDIIQGLEYLIPSTRYNPLYDPQTMNIKLRKPNPKLIDEENQENEESEEDHSDTNSTEVLSSCDSSSSISTNPLSFEPRDENINSFGVISFNHGNSQIIMDELYGKLNHTQNITQNHEDENEVTDDEENPNRGNVEGGGPPTNNMNGNHHRKMEVDDIHETENHHHSKTGETKETETKESGPNDTELNTDKKAPETVVSLKTTNHIQAPQCMDNTTMIQDQETDPAQTEQQMEQREEEDAVEDKPPNEASTDEAKIEEKPEQETEQTTKENEKGMEVHIDNNNGSDEDQCNNLQMESKENVENGYKELLDFDEDEEDEEEEEEEVDECEDEDDIDMDMVMDMDNDYKHNHHHNHNHNHNHIVSSNSIQNNVIELSSDDSDHDMVIDNNGDRNGDGDNNDDDDNDDDYDDENAADHEEEEHDDNDHMMNGHLMMNGHSKLNWRHYSKQDEFMRYPQHSPKPVIVSIGDIGRLRPSTYLNDSIIDFYLKYIYKEIIDEQQREDIHIFNQFFYTKLDRAIDEKNEKSRLRLAKWTKNVNIFEKKVLIIPINNTLHWSLAIITNPGYLEPLSIMIDGDGDDEEETGTETKDICKNILLSIISQNVFNEPSWIHEMETNVKILAVKNYPCKILHFDSMRGCHPTNEIFDKLRIYLTDEWKRKYKEKEREFTLNTMPGISLGVPQQMNSADCGVYLLHFAELFALNPFYDSGNSITRNEWFTPNDITKKRNEIKALCIKLRKEQGKHEIDIDHILDKLQITVESQSGFSLNHILDTNNSHHQNHHYNHLNGNNNHYDNYYHLKSQSQSQAYSKYDTYDEYDEYEDRFRDFEDRLWSVDNDLLKDRLAMKARNDPQFLRNLKNILDEIDETMENQQKRQHHNNYNNYIY